MTIEASALTDYPPAIGTNVKPAIEFTPDLWQYVLVWEYGSVDKSAFVFDTEAEARQYAARDVRSTRNHALRCAEDYDEYVRKGLIAPTRRT